MFGPNVSSASGSGLPDAVVDAAFVDGDRQRYSVVLCAPWQVGSSVAGGQHAAVGRRRRDGARVHQRDIGHLSVAGLAALAVGEVSRGVADGQAAVGRARRPRRSTARRRRSARITPASIRSATRRFSIKCHASCGWLAGIDGQRERARSRCVARRRMSVARHDILIQCRRSSPRSRPDRRRRSPSFDLIGRDSAWAHCRSSCLARFRLGLLQDIRACSAFNSRIGIGVGGMEGQRDHRLDQWTRSTSTSPSYAAPLLPAQAAQYSSGRRWVSYQPFTVLVGLPDRGQAGGFGRHDVDAVAEFHGEVGNAGANEFHDLVLDKAAVEHLL